MLDFYSNVLTYFISKYELVDISNQTLWYISTNNYKSRLGYTKIIRVHELGTLEYITTISNIMNDIRLKENNTVIDFKFINHMYRYDVFKDSVKDKAQSSYDTIANSSSFPKRTVEECKQFINSYESAVNNEVLRKTEFLIFLHNKDKTKLEEGVEIMVKYLRIYQYDFEVVNIGIWDILRNTSIISKQKKLNEEVEAFISNNRLLSELQPNNSTNLMDKGVYLGVNIKNNQPIFLDYSTITKARNVLVVAPSGEGKTVLTLSQVASLLEFPHYRGVVFDIKGNEFTSLTKFFKGYELDMSTHSTYYLNSLAFYYDDTKDIEYNKDIVLKCKALTSNIILLLSSLTEEESEIIYSYVDKFINDYYTAIGFKEDNPSLYQLTHQLNYFDFYNDLTVYLSKITKYKVITEKMILNLNQYFRRGATYSYLFKNPISLNDILNSKVLTFSFNALKGNLESIAQQTLFKFKYLQCKFIKDVYLNNNFNQGFRTVNVNEEAQIVDKIIIEEYIKDFTLRRSQNVDNYLLVNSILTLKDKGYLYAILENTTIFLLSTLSKEAMDIIYTTIEKKFEVDLDRNEFLLIDNTNKKGLRTKIKVIITEDMKLFKPQKLLVKDEDE